MNQQIDQIKKSLTEIISGWRCIKAVTVLEVGTPDLLDPYFFLSFDLYYDGKLPDKSERQQALGEVGAFETSITTIKDRFLAHDIPVRLEYRNISETRYFLDAGINDKGVFKKSGTYLLYRLKESAIQYDPKGLISQFKDSISGLPDLFWEKLKENAFAKAEHSLSDLQASVIRDDSYFFMISMADFITSFCSLLYILNKQFEPSDRLMSERIMDLKILPENFRGRFDLLLSDEAEMTRARKKEVAQLLVLSVIPMI